MADKLGFPFEVGGPSSGLLHILGRPPSVITERIPRSSGLLAAPPLRSKEWLAPQAWQVFCDLDKVIRGLPRSSGSWMLTVYFGAPSMFITLWFGFDYGTNPPLGTLII
jgi:hypothetical protein